MNRLLLTWITENKTTDGLVIAAICLVAIAVIGLLVYLVYMVNSLKKIVANKAAGLDANGKPLEQEPIEDLSDSTSIEKANTDKKEE